MDRYKSYLPKFFAYYAKFDYKNKVIFPYSGETVNKQNYPHQEQLRKYE